MAVTEEVEKFNKIWRGLHRALSMPVFGPCEQSILQVAQELSFTSAVLDGSGKAREFVIYPAKLAAARGFTREAISRSITRLMEGNVLTGTRDRLRLNKRYKTWTGVYALSEAQTAECLAADVRPVTTCGAPLVAREGRKRDRSVTETVIDRSQDDADRDQAVTENVTGRSRAKLCRDRTITESVTERSRHRDQSITTHIEDRARKREQREERDTNSHSNVESEVRGSASEGRFALKAPRLPLKPDPLPENVGADDDPGMKYVRDMILQATKNDRVQADLAVHHFVDWRSQGHHESTLKAAFVKAVQKGCARKGALINYARSVVESEADRASVPLPARPAPPPVEYHRAPGTRPKPSTEFRS